jgi:paraquat-inducible protein A
MMICIALGVWLILPALALFIVGILSPCVIINEFGNVRQLSLIDGIRVLWATGHTFLAIVIFVFTILFPPVKLALTAAVASPALPLGHRNRRRLRKLVELLGRWSLLDVLVIAILIVVIKVRGFVSVEATWGTYAFTFSIALSMLATHFLKAGGLNIWPSLRSTIRATDPIRARLGTAGRANVLTTMALALAIFGLVWFILAPAGTVKQIHVTRKETFIELPRLLGNPSFYVQVQTLEGSQRLDTKFRTPMGNGLMWTLKKSVPLPSIYGIEIFEAGLFSDKLVDRVTINDRREVGQHFQFELKGRRDWQRPAALASVAVGIGLLLVIKSSRRREPNSP